MWYLLQSTDTDIDTRHDTDTDNNLKNSTIQCNYKRWCRVDFRY
jgi:hypothetical protein